MKVFKNVKDANHPFTMMSNDAIRDPNLSFKAKGLLLLILSLPDNWTLRESHMLSMTRDGRDSYQSGLKELEEAGYVTKCQKKDDQGKFMRNEYIVYESLTYSCRTNQPIQDHAIRDADIPLPDNSAYRTLSQSGEDLTDTPLTDIPQNNTEAPLTEVPFTDTTPYINIECINNQPKKKTKTNTDSPDGDLFSSDDVTEKGVEEPFQRSEQYQHVLDIIKQCHPTAKHPKPGSTKDQKWCNTLRQLCHIDKYKPTSCVLRVFDWVFSEQHPAAQWYREHISGLDTLRKTRDGKHNFDRMVDIYCKVTQKNIHELMTD